MEKWPSTSTNAIYNFFGHFIMKLVYKGLSSRKKGAEYFCILSEMVNFGRKMADGQLLFWTL